jgi:hypothetical protein
MDIVAIDTYPTPPWVFMALCLIKHRNKSVSTSGFYVYCHSAYKILINFSKVQSYKNMHVLGKGKSKVVPVLNEVTRHEDVLGK